MSFRRMQTEDLVFYVFRLNLDFSIFSNVNSEEKKTREKESKGNNNCSLLT